MLFFVTKKQKAETRRPRRNLVPSVGALPPRINPGTLVPPPDMGPDGSDCFNPTYASPEMQ